MPRPRKNMALSASAGTGKTYRLALRYLALLAAGVPPDRICALTFSRKAAGEILDMIVEQLCRAAGSSGNRAAIAGGIAQEALGAKPADHPAAYLALLRTLIDSQHRLRIGTLDSFLLSIVRTFPFELGVPPDIQPMDGEGGEAQTQRQALLLQLLDPTYHPGHAGGQARATLLDALREAQFGRTSKTLSRAVDGIIAEDYGFFLDHNAPEIAWGVPGRIWPPPAPWWLTVRASIPGDLPEQLVDAFGTDARGRQLGNAVATIAEAAQHHAPDRPWPADITRSSVYQQLCEAAGRGAAKRGAAKLSLTYYRKDYPVPDALWRPLRAALAGLFRIEVERACRATAGRHRLLTLYDGLYRDAQRADGRRYTFEDLARLLGDPRHLPSRQAGVPDRLYIDYRLDGELDHWLLDEFQDTSNMQWAAIRNLVDEVVQDPHRSFFYVGDVKQSIYGWRGGNHKLFGQVLSEAGGGIETGEPMIVCHRSVPAIIDTVNRVFDGLAGWAPANAGTAGPRAGAVSDFASQWDRHQSAHPDDQAGFAALLEYEPKKKGEAPAEDDESADDPAEFEAVAEVLKTTTPLERGFSAAVLVRSNAAGRGCVDVLRRQLPSVPVVHEGTGGIVDSPVVTVLLALARYAAHPGDTVALRHLQMSPLGAALRPSSPDARPSTPPIDWDRLPGVFLSGVQDTGFAVQLRHWGDRLGDLDAFGRQRLAELCAVAEPFDATGSRDADAFCAAVTEARLKNFAAAGVVRVMTVHQSKGLGFDLVIVPFSTRSKSFGSPGDPEFLAASDWVLKPPVKAVLEAAGGPPLDVVEAARTQANFSQLCVLYVALTRAKRALYMIVPKKDKSATVIREADLLKDRLAGAGAPGEGPGGLSQIYACGDCAWHIKAPSVGVPTAAPTAAAIPVVFASRMVRHEPSKELGAARTLSAQWIFSLESGDVRAFGSALHGLFQKIEWLETTDIDRLVAEWRATAAGSPAVLGDVERQFRECLARDEVRRCLARPSAGAAVWAEAPFDLLLDRDGGQRILSGRFDRLVVEHNAAGRVTGATVVDFKSDRVRTEGELRDRVAGHVTQMRDYAQVAAQLLGLAPTAIRSVLLFTRIGRVVPVE